MLHRYPSGGASARPGVLPLRSMKNRRSQFGATPGSTSLHRLAPLVQFRAADDGVEGRFQAIVLRYEVLDDYDTKFAQGVFTESMNERMPRIVWGHDWRQVLGRWIEYKERNNALVLTGQMDSFDHVPMARQAFYQLESGTIDQFSVGFVPTEWFDAKLEAEDKLVRTFTKGRLDEVSLVLTGAVPNTELLSLRTGGLKLHVRQPLIAKDDAADVLIRLHSGDIDLADALMEIKTLAPVADDATGDDPNKPKEGAESGEKPPAGTAPLTADEQAAADAETARLETERLEAERVESERLNDEAEAEALAVEKAKADADALEAEMDAALAIAAARG